jgi:hypothetical protein
MQSRVDGAADAIDIDAAGTPAQRPGVEDHDATDVHVAALVLKTQKRRV